MPRFIPKPQSPMVGGAGLPTPEWYDYLKQALEAAEGNDALQAQINAILQQLADLGGGFTLTGPQSVRVVGTPSNGFVQVMLDGDEATPSASYYYGTDAGGARGWHELALPTLSDVDLSGLVDGDSLVWNASTSKWEAGQTAPPQVFNRITEDGDIRVTAEGDLRITD